MPCGSHGFEEYTGRDVSTSARGGIGPLLPHRLNSVKAEWARRAQDGSGSSVHDYVGYLTDAPVTPRGLSVDRVGLPAHPRRGKIQDSKFKIQGVPQSDFSRRKMTLR